MTYLSYLFAVLGARSAAAALTTLAVVATHLDGLVEVKLGSFTRKASKNLMKGFRSLVALRGNLGGRSARRSSSYLSGDLTTSVADQMPIQGTWLLSGSAQRIWMEGIVRQ